MQVFAKVAALGSLSATARALGMSQTMATKHVAALEERLGVRLFNRSTRRLSLTEAGRSYLDAVERILEDLQEADALASLQARQVRGTLRLNAPVSFGLRKVAPLLPALTVRHPELQVELGLNDRHVDLVEEGWDLAIRIGTLANSALIARRLASCPMVVAAAPDYLARHGTPATVTELAAHNCLGYTLSQLAGVRRWSFGRAGKISVEVSGSIQSNNGDALVLAAVAGAGIIYQPSFLVDQELRDGVLVPLSLDHEAIEIGGIYAIHSSRRPPAKVSAAIDFFAEALVARSG
ncbi:MAG: LysR family transcriptional regulator [Hyphomicrobiaceae bacterium]|nr:LysR family transcriptional regulator [Hyphomicrobiaceae bacterium]